MAWYTLVQGPNGTPIPMAITDKERPGLREVEGASLFESEEAALQTIREHHTPTKAGSRFIGWNGRTRLYVIHVTDAERRMKQRVKGDR